MSSELEVLLVELGKLTRELEVLDLGSLTRELENFFQKFETRPSVSSYSSTF